MWLVNREGSECNAISSRARMMPGAFNTIAHSSQASPGGNLHKHPTSTDEEKDPDFQRLAQHTCSVWDPDLLDLSPCLFFIPNLLSVMNASSLHEGLTNVVFVSPCQSCFFFNLFPYMQKSIMVKGMDSKDRLPGFKPRCAHLLAVWPGASY